MGLDAEPFSGCVRSLIVGEAPSRGVTLARGEALRGRAARALWRCARTLDPAVADLDPDVWLTSLFRTVNVVPIRPTVWSIPRARANAEQIRRREINWVRGDRVVLLGRKVGTAFGIEKTRPWFDSWTETRGGEPVRFWLVPHPSGRSRVMNDPEIQRGVAEALAAASMRP